MGVEGKECKKGCGVSGLCLPWTGPMIRRRNLPGRGCLEASGLPSRLFAGPGSQVYFGH